MSKRWWLVGLAVALIVAFLSPLASSNTRIRAQGCGTFRPGTILDPEASA